MSFLTECFDEYRPHPIRKTIMCRPENRWAKVEGRWLDPTTDLQDKSWSKEETELFIKNTMKVLRGQSTYYNDYCAHLPPEFKGPFVPRPKKKKKPCKTEGTQVEVEDEPTPEPGLKLAMKDTELMKVAKQLYEPDPSTTVLEPLRTHPRILGYARPAFYKTGISDYQYNIGRLAYEMVRDDRIPRYYAHNGCRPRWGLPPEGVRQPILDGIPYYGERLYN